MLLPTTPENVTFIDLTHLATDIARFTNSRIIIIIIITPPR